MIPLPVGTAVVVTVGPCIDDTDFKSRETTIAYNAAGMDIELNKKGVNSTSTDAITPTSGGNNDWVHIAGAEYSLELTAAQNDTLGTLHVVGVCTGVLPFESPVYTVVPVVVYNALVAGTDKLQVDLVEVGGVAQTATDLKDFADTGYDPGTHKVQGVVLADTCTANTDMVGTDNAALASVCTEARLAELAAANLPTDIAAVAALIAALNDLSAANVNAEVVDVLKTDTIAQRTQSAPPAAPTFEEAVMWLYQFFRNKRTQSTTQITIYADDESTVIAKLPISDAASLFTWGEVVSGP